MTKVLLILMVCGMIANGLASLRSEPPLLIDSHPTSTPIATLDEAR
ncbi:MAG TPA: hypothetical protein VHS33_01535 [Sphingomicrobium sp.]|nr:hypothetical protein [Sphingomicrobium sp.]